MLYLLPFAEICKQNTKIAKTLTLKLKVKVNKYNNGLSPCEWKYSNPYELFFRMLSTWERTFTQNDTHVHTRIHIARDRGGDYRQNLEIDLPNKLSFIIIFHQSARFIIIVTSLFESQSLTYSVFHFCLKANADMLERIIRTNVTSIVRMVHGLKRGTNAYKKGVT